MPKISIVIIHYNTPHYLKTCLDSIFAQSYQNIEVFFIDNDSPDQSGVVFVEKHYKNQLNAGKLHLVKNKENLGYAKAANQGIRLAIGKSTTAGKDTAADYVVITNPDIIYSPTYFEKIVYRAEKDAQIAAITGKVYKYDFKEKKPTKIIDTVGLYIDSSLRVVDGAQGKTDEGQFDKEKEVFGISGACPMYSVKALEKVKIGTASSDQFEYFDEDFFMYKEDVDLSWRFQLAGFKCLYYPKAVAFHGRGTGVVERTTLKQIFKNRKNLSRFQRFYSFRNNYLMRTKNTPLMTAFRYFPFIIARDITALIYTIFYEPFQFKAIYQFFKLLPSALRKRKHIMGNKTISAKKLNKWMKEKPEN